MPSHSIYALCEPGTRHARYVGRTSTELSFRLGAHLSRAKDSNGRREFDRWLQGLMAKDQRPEIVRLEVVSQEEVAQKEAAWIALLIENGNSLFNRQLLPKQLTTSETKRKPRRKNETGIMFSPVKMRALLSARGENHWWLAEASGLHVNTISKLLAEDEPFDNITIGTVNSIAAALGCDPLELMNVDGVLADKAARFDRMVAMASNGGHYEAA